MDDDNESLILNLHANENYCNVSLYSMVGETNILWVSGHQVVGLRMLGMEGVVGLRTLGMKGVVGLRRCFFFLKGVC